jgi:rubredoxin
MKELVRCRPCGFVIESDKLGDVCPACGMPRKVFEPYRERVSRNRLMLLNLDLHPIAIHLSQALVIAIITGVIDGLTRFKTLSTPILRVKIIFSLIILTLSIGLFFVSKHENLYAITITLSILSFGAGIQLGLWGKKLINVILPGTYPQKKGTKAVAPEPEKA